MCILCVLCTLCILCTAYQNCGKAVYVTTAGMYKQLSRPSQRSSIDPVPTQSHTWTGGEMCLARESSLDVHTLCILCTLCKLRILSTLCNAYYIYYILYIDPVPTQSHTWTGGESSLDVHTMHCIPKWWQSGVWDYSRDA